MANRTTADKVRSILGRNYMSGANLDPHIATANAIVSNAVSKATADGATISTANAALMEMWISAWCYTLMDPMYVSKSTLSASGTFSIDKDGNQYRKAAIALDDTGWLEAVLDGSYAGAFWLGKTAAEELSFNERIGYY